jgi:predicted nucleic acid-binding protein
VEAPRVFLDANVLFSAAWSPGGLSALIVELGRVGRIELVTSRLAVIEAQRNLEAKRPMALGQLEVALRSILVVNEPGEAAVERLAPRSLSPKDRPLLAAAIAAHATHFVTGDRRDFGSWMDRPDSLAIRVLTPRQFFTEVEPSRSS